MSTPTSLPTEDLDHVVEHTGDVWEELRGRNIFITGGTGFFGRWLIESFVWANERLGLDARAVVLSRSPDLFRAKAPHLFENAAIEFVRGDIREFEGPAREFAFVIHAATEASAQLNREEPLRMFETIVQGTRSALEFAVARGAKRFLLTSSGAVYGPQPSEITRVPESYGGGPDPTTPASAYGEGKRAAEQLCACLHQEHGIETVIARCFAFVGPFLPLDTHFAIGNFIRDALGGGPIRVGGDGTPYRSYLYAADLTIWLWTLLVRGQACRPYNVGSARDLTIADLAGVVRATLAPSSSVTIAAQPVMNARPSRYVPDTTRAQEELGLQERIDLATAIQRTARHQTR